MQFTCPLDIAAYYLKYTPEFVAYCKSRGYYGDFWVEKVERRMKGPWTAATKPKGLSR